MVRRLHRRWKRFKPYRHHRDRRLKRWQYKRRDITHDKEYMVPRELPQFVCDSTDFYDCAEQEIATYIQRRAEVRDLDKKIDRLRARFEESGLAHDGMVALLAQVPRAVLAQIQMDKYPRGYQNKQARLYELIDFNDTFDDTILAMTREQRKDFPVRAKQAADRICQRVGAPTFTDDQWEATVRGLSREIALYLAALDNGFEAVMTPRSQDALGVDMQIRDPETGRYINIDCKSPSSFRYRLEQLIKENRISEGDLLRADDQSYLPVINGHGSHRVRVILLCILPDRFGEIVDFEFVDTASMREMLNRIIREHGLSDDRFDVV